MPKLQKIISGGQTGVDQAALQLALELGFDIGGWCPPNRACEDGQIPDIFPLVPTPEEHSARAPHIARSLRTEWNVRDSHATLILLPDTLQPDPGTAWTIACTKHYGKPSLIANPFSTQATHTILQWLLRLQPSTLNIAGPSEKTCNGIALATARTLKPALLQLKHTQA